jgi:hypothetical protein
MIWATCQEETDSDDQSLLSFGEDDELQTTIAHASPSHALGCTGKVMSQYINTFLGRALFGPESEKTMLSPSMKCCFVSAISTNKDDFQTVKIAHGCGAHNQHSQNNAHCDVKSTGILFCHIFVHGAEVTSQSHLDNILPHMCALHDAKIRRKLIVPAGNPDQLSEKGPDNVWNITI